MAGPHREARPGGARRAPGATLNALRHAAAVLAATSLAAVALPARAAAHVGVGAVVENARLESIAGPPQSILDGAEVHVIVFLKPGQDRSLDAAKQLAGCEKALSSRLVRLVGLV